MTFDPKQHMSNLKGREYLEVKWRLVWFREEHPAESGWGIDTDILRYDEKIAAVKARIIDPDGRVVATGTKQEQPSHFGDYLEKAETGAIGRALAALGYGTQFAPELEEGERIVDSPVDKSAEKKPAKKPGDDHPNKTPQTEALCKAIYIAAGGLGWDNAKVKEAVRAWFKNPAIESLYDMGREEELYQKVLAAINKRLEEKKGGGS